MIFIGIDPGLSGGIAVIHDGMGIQDLFVTPTIAGKGSKREYDIHAMAKILYDYKDGWITIERSQAMPGQGVTSMFSIGKGYGIWLGIISAYDIKYQVVAPITWSKAMCSDMQHEDTKQRNLIVCKRIFPNANLLATERSKKPHEGIVDSLLIAEYGRRKILGGQ